MKKFISRRALEQRIRRRLEKDGYTLHKNRRGPYEESLGDYYTVNLQRNAVDSTHIDIEELGREIGALKRYEVMADD
jgi:hypothetical protein